MDEILKLREKLTIKRPATWEALPDIELYKDQVLNYMQRQHTLKTDDSQLTGAMINNYIKSGLLQRASGKKYTKDHLAYLTAICSLKQVLSVNETDILLKKQPHIADAEQFYNEYYQQMDNALTQAANKLDENITKEQLAVVAMQFAVTSYAQKLACEKVLDIIKDLEKKLEK